MRPKNGVTFLPSLMFEYNDQHANHNGLSTFFYLHEMMLYFLCLCSPFKISHLILIYYVTVIAHHTAVFITVNY